RPPRSPCAGVSAAGRCPSRRRGGPDSSRALGSGVAARRAAPRSWRPPTWAGQITTEPRTVTGLRGDVAPRLRLGALVTTAAEDAGSRPAAAANIRASMAKRKRRGPGVSAAEGDAEPEEAAVVAPAATSDDGGDEPPRRRLRPEVRFLVTFLVVLSVSFAFLAWTPVNDHVIEPFTGQIATA